MNQVKSEKNSSTFFTEQIQLELCHFSLPPIQLIRYDINHYSDNLYSAFHIDQPPQLEQWVTKRKAQFLAGRVAARESLRTIGSTDTIIPSGLKREPIWPKKLLGSISHASGFSVASVMRHEALSTYGTGLDVQEILTSKEIKSIKKATLTTRDQIFFEKKVKGLSDNQLLTLIFSAKESFFKAVYKNIGQYFDFDVISVKDLDVESQKMTLVSETTLSNEITINNEYSVFLDILEIETPTVITHCVI